MKKALLYFVILLWSFKLQAQCLYNDVVVEAYECDEGNNFLVDIDFNAIGVTDSFKVKVNNALYGVFSYDELFLTIGPFPGDCETNYLFAIQDNQLEECNTLFELGEVCCEGGGCEIGDIEFEIECDGPIAHVFVDFEHIGTGESFSLKGNGNDYGDFNYSELPIDITLTADCETDYELVVIDNNTEGCLSDIGIGEICCGVGNCGLDITSVTMITCENGLNFTVAFDYVDVQNVGWDLWINEVFYGFYTYEEIPLAIEEYQTDDTTISIRICDNDNEYCCDELVIDNPCATSNINKEQLSKISIKYDNGRAIIDNKSDSLLNFEIYSVNGQAVYNDHIGAFAQKKIHSLITIPGLYFIKFEMNGTQKVEKFVIN